MNIPVIIITFVILIFSAIIHEVAHGVVAGWLGDDTARDMGRITLNPIPHIDPMGTILLPLLVYLGSGGRFWFGAAKPVPVNFNNLRNPKSGMALVSFAGPASNFLIAIFCAIILNLGVGGAAGQVLLLVVFVNIMLGTFNLIPIPPLDGSKILASLLPDEWVYRLLSLERWGFILVLIFVYLGWFEAILTPVLMVFGRIFNINFFG